MHEPGRCDCSGSRHGRPPGEKASSLNGLDLQLDRLEPALRKSHENPHVIKLYEEFLTDGPCGEVSHKYLHTHYTPRGDYLV
jgi:iron only hydrogenase large subunit-like protein